MATALRTDVIFEQYSRYYDLLYRDKDYVGEAGYVASTLREANRGTRTILEFGSGTGRHARLLAERGFDVTGLERSASMRAAAEDAARAWRPGPGTFCQLPGDLRETRVGLQFDAVIALFHVVSYQTSDDDLGRTFANAAHHLRPGGVFLFDVWHGPAVLHEPLQVRVKHVEDHDLRIWRISEPALYRETHTVRVKFTLFAAQSNGHVEIVEEEHRMRYLFEADVRAWASATGFQVELAEEFGTRAVPSDVTWGVAYLLRRTQ